MTGSIRKSNVFRKNGHSSDPVLINYAAKSTLVRLTDSQVSLFGTGNNNAHPIEFHHGVSELTCSQH